MSPRERTLVPPARFESYYGKPILKEPAWKVPDVPLYLTLGGMSGAASVMAAVASVTGPESLVRAGRVAAGVGAVGSVAALVHDLGRPLRFLNMLRVLKPTSPLSVGSWILAPYSTLAAVSAVATVAPRIDAIGRARLASLVPALASITGTGAALLGPAMATYTAVLLCDTAIPAWHEAYRAMPFVFAGSALASGAATGLLSTDPGQAAPARRMATLGAAVELAASHRIENDLGLVGESYTQGRPRAWLSAGRALTGTGVALAWAGRRSRVFSGAAGASLLAASYCTRHGIFEAGRESARDPKYVVVPQRERRKKAAAEGAVGRR